MTLTLNTTQLLGFVGIIIASFVFIAFLFPLVISIAKKVCKKLGITKDEALTYLDIIQSILLTFKNSFLAKNNQLANIIANVALEIVQACETTEKDNSDKHADAFTQISNKLLSDYGIVIPDDALNIIIKAAVSQLPSTHSTTATTTAPIPAIATNK